jgi:hypothetical protein
MSGVINIEDVSLKISRRLNKENGKENNLSLLSSRGNEI